jgi:hypothetical protein
MTKWVKSPDARFQQDNTFDIKEDIKTNIVLWDGPNDIFVDGEPCLCSYPSGKLFRLLGKYATLTELTSHVTSPSIGDAYAVGDEPYIYFWANSTWNNAGTLKGDKGDTGASAYDNAVSTGQFTGTEEEYQAWLRKPATDAAELAGKSIVNANNAASEAYSEATAAKKASDDTLTLDANINAAETERKAQETLRSNNENDRITKESERKTEETKRDAQEKNRIDAEAARYASEKIRIASENSRIEAEKERVSSEILRETEEEARDTAEKARKSDWGNLKNDASTLVENMGKSETQRETNEDERKKNEDERIAAEKSRVAYENTRKDNETLREAAETLRKNAETARENEEKNRVEAEKKRNSDFRSHKTQTDDAIALTNEMANHPDIIGTDGYWYKWNSSTDKYEKTDNYGLGGFLLDMYIDWDAAEPQLVCEYSDTLGDFSADYDKSELVYTYNQ